MQKWLDDNDILMYSTHNEGKSVVAERFIRTLKGRIYKKMTVNDCKSCLGYLNTNTIILIIVLLEKTCSWLFFLDWRIETNFRATNLKVGDRVKITKNKNIFSKDCAKNWSREYLLLSVYWN